MLCKYLKQVKIKQTIFHCRNNFVTKKEKQKITDCYEMSLKRRRKMKHFTIQLRPRNKLDRMES